MDLKPREENNYMNGLATSKSLFVIGLRLFWFIDLKSFICDGFIMKRIISISLGLIFCLFQIGYLAIYFHLIQQNTIKWLATTEFSGEFKKIEILISLPYWQDQEDFQPTDGTMVIDGLHYRKVFQKYANEKVIVLLQRDYSLDQIKNTTRQLVESNAGTDAGDSSASGLIVLLKQDFQSSPLDFFHFYSESTGQKHQFDYLDFNSDVSLSIPTPPPLGWLFFIIS